MIKSGIKFLVCAIVKSGLERFESGLLSILATGGFGYKNELRL